MLPRQTLFIFFVSLLLVFVTYKYLHFVTKVDQELISKEPHYSNNEMVTVPTELSHTNFQASLLENFHRQHSGINITGLVDIVGSGICIADLNNDRFQDVIYIAGTGHNRDFGKVAFWTNFSSSVRVLINNQGKELVDQTSQWLKDGSLMDMGCTTADFNSDGYIDVVITGSKGAEVLKNLNGNMFSAHQLISSTPFWGTSVSAKDINNDNKLDIYISTFVKYKNWSKSKESNAGFQLQTSPNFQPEVHNAQQNKIFLNSENFRFEESLDYQQSIGSEDIRSLDHLWFDFNNDGLEDLYITSFSGSASKLFLKTKEGHFVKDSKMYPLLELDGVLSVSLNDFHQDGSQELIINRDTANLSLIYHLNNGIIKDATSKYLNAIERLSGSYSSVIINDRDDSDLILFANGTTQLDQLRPRETVGQNNVLVKNTKALKLPTKFSTRGAATVDINNDGNLEILLNNNNSFLEIVEQKLPGNMENSWVGLDFIGNTNDSISVEYKSKSYRAPSKQGYLSSSDKRIIIKKALAGSELLINSSTETLSIKLTEEMLNSYLLINVNQNVEVVDTYKSTKLEIATTIKRLAHDVNSNVVNTAINALDYIKNDEGEEFFYILDDVLQHESDSSIYCKATNILSYFYQEEEAGINNKYKLVRTLISNTDKFDSGIKLSCTLHALGKSETKLAALFIEERLLKSEPGHISYLWLRALRDTKEIKSPKRIYNNLKMINNFKLVSELLLLVIDSGTEFELSPADILDNIQNQQIKSEVVSYLYYLYPTYHKKISLNYDLDSINIIPIEELLLARNLNNLSINDLSLEELDTLSKHKVKDKRNSELLLDSCTNHLVKPGNFLLSIEKDKMAIKRSFNVCSARIENSSLASEVLNNYKSILNQKTTEYLEGILIK